MKRLLVLVLLVPILALTMISCDADMRSNIAGLMGGLGGNVYEDAGWIVINTAQAEAAAAIVAAIGTGAGAEAVTAGSSSTSLGLSVTVPVGAEKMMAPQSADKQKELKDNLGDAFNSTTQKAKLLEDLKKPVTDAHQKKAAQGTVLVLNQALDDLKLSLTGSSDLGTALEKLKLPVIADGDTLTQGDMLALQLMTDLISNTVGSLKSIGGGALSGVNATELEKPENKSNILSIVDDALFAASMAEQISGAASIDFTGQINLGDLMDGLGDRGTRSRGDDIALTDAEDFIGTINDLAPSIVELMGVTYDGNNFVYTDAKYKSFLLSQQIYRSAMDQALEMMKLGKLTKDDVDSLTFDTSTLVKYALAVLLTEHDDFAKDEVKNHSATLKANEIILLYLNDSVGNKHLGLGTLVNTDSLTQPAVGIGETFDYGRWPAFLKTKTKPYYQAILSNIIKINDLGGIAQLSTELTKFYDPAHPEATDDGLSDWYDDLY